MLIEGNEARVAMVMLVTWSVSRGSEDHSALSSREEMETHKKEKKEGEIESRSRLGL